MVIIPSTWQYFNSSQYHDAVYVYKSFKSYASTLQTAGILILNDFYILCSIQIKLSSVTPLQTLNNKYASCITSVIIICMVGL